MRLLSTLLTKFVRKGRLRVYDAGGMLHTFGCGEGGPDVTIRLNVSGVSASETDLAA